VLWHCGHAVTKCVLPATDLADTNEIYIMSLVLKPSDLELEDSPRATFINIIINGALVEVHYAKHYVPNSAKFRKSMKIYAETGKFCGSAQNSTFCRKLWSLTMLTDSSQLSRMNI